MPKPRPMRPVLPEESPPTKFKFALIPDVQAFMWAEVIENATCGKSTNTEQIVDMFKWIFADQTTNIETEGLYKFAAFVGDIVDGNGGVQLQNWDTSTAAGLDMWETSVEGKSVGLIPTFEEITKLNQGPQPIPIAAVTGNHDYKGNDFGAGLWENIEYRTVNHPNNSVTFFRTTSTM